MSPSLAQDCHIEGFDKIINIIDVTDSHIESGLCGPDLGEVGNPFALGNRCFAA